MAAKQAVDGAKIRDLRTKRGWSQQHLAKAAEIDPRTVQRVEAENRASFETIRALADAFQLEIQELMAVPAPSQPGEPARPLPRFLNRVRTGAELSSLIVGAHQSGYANDEPETQEEVDTIGAFFTELNEAAEIWNEMPPGMRLQAEFDFT